MGKGTKVSWKYYNHAMIPNCAPHEVPDMKSVEDGSVWRGGGGTSQGGQRIFTVVRNLDFGLVSKIMCLIFNP